MSEFARAMHRLNIRYLLQNLGQTFSLSSSRTIEERAIVVPTSKVGDALTLSTYLRVGEIRLRVIRLLGRK